MNSALRCWCLLAILGVVGCGSPASPSRASLSQELAAWRAHAPPAYRFDYEFTGFFAVGVGQPFRITVRHDTVQSVINLSTGQPDTAVWRFPTIETLFQSAQGASQSGSLSNVSFNLVLHYPTEIDIAGPPDAGGSLFASNLAALP